MDCWHGIGFTDAWKALRALPLTDEAIAGIGAKAIEALGKARKWCTRNSFPGTTRVLMSDGTTKEIKDVAAPKPTPSPAPSTHRTTPTSSTSRSTSGMRGSPPRSTTPSGHPALITG
ncbi:hypothetical protein [Streptomyces sp. NPDC004065]|uniref:hypothetical protein n=1 Tax=Streptomyces sp. NPDC004065 TaxID=3364689 RepID=UPI0038510BFD